MQSIDTDETMGPSSLHTWNLLTAHKNGNIASWDINRLECKLIIAIENGPINSFVVSNELGLWITGHQDGTIKYIKESKNMKSNQLTHVKMSRQNDFEFQEPLVLVPKDTGELRSSHVGAPILKLLHEKGCILSCSTDKLMLYGSDFMINEARKNGIELAFNDNDQM